MKTQFLKLLCLLVLSPTSVLFAEDEQVPRKSNNNLKLAFEFGANGGWYGAEKFERVRENRSSFDNYYYSDDFNGSVSLSTSYFGIKPEYFVWNNRIGIASGLRFTQASSILTGYRRSWFSNRDKFLWKIKEEGLNTDYVQIDDFAQKSYLLGIPLEVRIFPNNRELPVQHYFKMGISFNYRVHSEYNINFTNPAMEKHDDLVKSQMPHKSEFSSFFYGAFGFKIGKFREGRWIPWGNIELQIPYVQLTNSIAFANTAFFPGIGFQCSFQIPIGNNVPIGCPRAKVKAEEKARARAEAEARARKQTK